MENKNIKLWWYDPPVSSIPSGRNAGDYYGKWLLEQMGFTCEFSTEPDIITCGSILQASDWKGNPYVWGSGFHNKGDKPKSLTKIFAVRGKLSYGKLNTKKKIAVGDPGLLASRFYTPKTEKKYEFGFIPHYVDYNDFVRRYKKLNVPIIDIRTDDIEGLLDQINECRFIFSSSLHGIIFSHSLGIPAIHIENKMLYSKENFKFKDYYSVFNIDYIKEKWTNVKFSQYVHSDPDLYRPSKEELEEVQNNLLNSFPLNGKIAICAVAKCENNYINDWVKWHIDRGVDDIYLWDNNDADYEPVESRIDKDYLDKVHITKIPGAKEFQIPVYNKFYNDYRNEYDWIGFLDIDEYVVPKQWANIKAFLNDEKFKDYNVIKLNWHMFGDDDLPYRDTSIPVWQGITKRLKGHNFETHCKQFVRGRIDGDVEICSNHWCKINGDLPKQVMPDGDPTSVKISGARNCEEAYINHYMTKTLDEFINQKLARGTDASFGDRVIDLEYFWRINKKTEEKILYLNHRETKDFKDEGTSICIGIVSYIPGDELKRNVRKSRVKRLIKQLNDHFKLPIIIIAQNWGDFGISSDCYTAIHYYKDKLGVTNARMELRDKFLRTSYDYMIMLDDDMELSDNQSDYDDYLRKIIVNKREYYWVSNFLNNFSVISREAMARVNYDSGVDPEKGTGFEDYVFCERCKHDLNGMKLSTKLPKYERSHFLNDAYSTWINPEVKTAGVTTRNARASQAIIREIKGKPKLETKKREKKISRKLITNKNFY